MANIMDPVLPILSILGYWAIILGSSGGPGTQNYLTAAQICDRTKARSHDSPGEWGPRAQTAALSGIVVKRLYL